MENLGWEIGGEFQLKKTYVEKIILSWVKNFWWMDFGGLDEEMLYLLNETPAVSVSLSLSLASPWYRMIANVIFEILEPCAFKKYNT